MDKKQNTNIEKSVVWLDEEGENLILFKRDLVRILNNAGCSLKGPISTIAELTEYLIEHRDEIDANNTCLLLDIMLPGNSMIQLPKIITGADKDDMVRSRRGGFDAGLFFYANIILPNYTPPLPVIFLTSISNPCDTPLFNHIKDHLIEMNGNEEPKAVMLVKHPGTTDVDKIIDILNGWKFFSN